MSLQLALNGIKRADGGPRRVRYPITFNVLSVMCGLFTRFVDATIETACIVAYFGFLRCGEFTCGATFNSSFNLCVGDVTFAGDHLILMLKTSKTDPFRYGIPIKLFCNTKLVCHKCVLSDYVHQRVSMGATPSDALFVTNNNKPLTRSDFISLTRQTLQTCGFQPELYHGHSFRIGAATSAAACRIEDHMIKTLGRWSS